MIMYILLGGVFVIIWVLYFYLSKDKTKEILNYPEHDVKLVINSLQINDAESYLTDNQKKIYRQIKSLDEKDYKKIEKKFSHIKLSKVDEILSFDKYDIKKILSIFKCLDKNNIKLTNKERKLYHLMNSLDFNEIQEFKERYGQHDLTIGSAEKIIEKLSSYPIDYFKSRKNIPTKEIESEIYDMISTLKDHGIDYNRFQFSSSRNQMDFMKKKNHQLNNKFL